MVAGGDVRAGDRQDEGVEALALGGPRGPLLRLLLPLGLALRLRGLLARPGRGLRLGGVLLGGGVHEGRLRGDLLGDAVEADDAGEAGVGALMLRGLRGRGEGADDGTGRERGDPGHLRTGAGRSDGRAAVPARGARERHEAAVPFLPSRLPG
ncbi:hypothetical protein STTU_1496 [Streptomyces sp. Tu6071]|nr:hypothetical protein STTU_1496 [Streptomyces sp. Tu6071]